MKILREKLAVKLGYRLAQKGVELAGIDRYNRQYDNLDEESPVDWSRGAVFIEVLPIEWEQCSDRRLQEGDATIRLHVCRTFYSSSASDSEAPDPLASLDLVNAVVVAIHGESLMDDQNRSLTTELIRVNQTEDNDHDGLEIDILEFKGRAFDYLTDTIGTTTPATPPATS